MDTPLPPSRRSIRWRSRDYAFPGAYFVTLCTAGRVRRFGAIRAGVMVLSPLGTRAAEAWEGLPGRFAAVELDRYVLMPDHLHGIVRIRYDTPFPASRVALGAVIGAYKSQVAVAWTRTVSSVGRGGAVRSLWQRGCFDRVIRDGVELARVRAYIDANVAKWSEDA